MQSMSEENSRGIYNKSGSEKDYEQIQEILQGAEELWEQLYRDAYPIVYSCVQKNDWNCLLRPEDYEDITDEAFARCYEHLERYRGESRFSTWVGGYAKYIVRNQCANQQTYLKNKDHMEKLALSRMATYDPYYVLLRWERDYCLWKAYYSLNRVDQEIVRRRLFEEDASNLIAEDLHMTRKEVLQRYRAAKLTMRQFFLRYYYIRRD